MTSPTIPKGYDAVKSAKPWHIRLKNGSRCMVIAAYEAKALEPAYARLKRLLENDFGPLIGVYG